MEQKSQHLMSLKDLGWTSSFQENFSEFVAQSYLPARVVYGQKQLYRLLGEHGEFQAEVSGKFRHEAVHNSDFPVVGDWVAMIPYDDDRAIIHALLPRKSKISRKEAGRATREQMIAANVDTVFIVTALDGYRGANIPRIERYLTQVYNTGATPVVLLNKADTCPDAATFVQDVKDVSFGVAVHAISAKEHQGLDPLMAYIHEGTTVALIGTSGVGKSTLINCLAGEERQRVFHISENTGKGFHTTTHRELILLPRGGMLIDNPGMRELQLWGDEQDVGGAFGDIEELAEACRFSDCLHQSEPGCAVLKALDEGELDEGRYQQYLKFRKELQFLEKRRDNNVEQVQRERGKRFQKMVRQMKKVVY